MLIRTEYNFYFIIIIFFLAESDLQAFKFLITDLIVVHRQVKICFYEPQQTTPSPSRTSRSSQKHIFHYVDPPIKNILNQFQMFYAIIHVKPFPLQRPSPILHYDGFKYD